MVLYSLGSYYVAVGSSTDTHKEVKLDPNLPPQPDDWVVVRWGRRFYIKRFHRVLAVRCVLGVIVAICDRAHVGHVMRSG